MKIKTSEATGLQLDWGLSLALGHEKTAYIAECGSVHGCDKDRGWTSVEHVDSYLCLALIKDHKITLKYCSAPVWTATPDNDGWGDIGDTPEQAIARCVIAMKLGDEFECPDELARGDL